MVRDRPEEFAAVALRLHPFPADSAGVVSGWARTREEVIMWCGHPAAPVTAEQINAWVHEDGVQPFGLYRDGRLVAYGELWVDDDEAEVELARLIVDPRERGHGLGRRLAMGLADRPGPGIRGSSCGSIRTTSPHGDAMPRRVSNRSPRIRRPFGTRRSRSIMCGSALPRNASQPFASSGSAPPAWRSRYLEADIWTELIAELFRATFVGQSARH
jgi:GNAT superfamily N-acetyltransferase